MSASRGNKAAIRAVPWGLNYAPAFPHIHHDTMAITQARTEEDQG